MAGCAWKSEGPTTLSGAMPSKPPTVCSFPGCPALVKRGRCAEHTVKQSERRRHDPEQRKFYSSYRWQQLRKLVRMRDPVCMECQRAPSQTVDHVNGDFRDNRMENLQGLCRECHASKSGRDHGRKS